MSGSFFRMYFKYDFINQKKTKSSIEFYRKQMINQ